MRLAPLTNTTNDSPTMFKDGLRWVPELTKYRYISIIDNKS